MRDKKQSLPTNRFQISSILAVIMLLVISALPQSHYAPSNSPAPPFVCSNGALQGRFATRGSGLAPANPMDPTSPLVPFANASLMTFDGLGDLTNAAVNSTNGTIIPVSNSGNYELNTDCTGTVTISSPVGVLTFYLVIADRGREFFMISTVNRSIVTVEGKRVQ